MSFLNHFFGMIDFHPFQQIAPFNYLFRGIIPCFGSRLSQTDLEIDFSVNYRVYEHQLSISGACQPWDSGNSWSNFFSWLGIDSRSFTALRVNRISCIKCFLQLREISGIEIPPSRLNWLKIGVTRQCGDVFDKIFQCLPESRCNEFPKLIYGEVFYWCLHYSPISCDRMDSNTLLLEKIRKVSGRQSKSARVSPVSLLGGSEGEDALRLSYRQSQ